MRIAPAFFACALASLLSGCGTAGPRAVPARAPAATRPGLTSFRDDAHGFSVRFPSGWHRAQRTLTPSLLDPVEILSLGTAPEPASPAGSCAEVPVGALRALGPRDVFLTLQERRPGPPAGGYPARTRPFRLGPPIAGEPQDCVGRPVPWSLRIRSFRDAGRSFDLFVAIGHDAPAARVRALRAVIDSLRFIRGGGVRRRARHAGRAQVRKALAFLDDLVITAAPE